MAFKPRNYRQWIKNDDLVWFEVVWRQTDLAISAEKRLEHQALEAIASYRQDIENYIRRNNRFFDSLEPVEVEENAPAIVRTMAEAAERAGVGPMASIAGAMAEFVGRELLNFSRQVIIENGGDIFIKTDKSRMIGVYAGEKSPFTGHLALEIEPNEGGLGVCTSSGTVSHSLSFGNADAVLIISEDTALADAVATATGNRVKSAFDIERGVDYAKSVDGVIGCLIIVGDKMGSWGEIKLV